MRKRVKEKNKKIGPKKNALELWGSVRLTYA